MKHRHDLTVFISDLNAPSEVFLRQLFDVLGKSFSIEVLCFKKPERTTDNLSFQVRYTRGYLSLSFLTALPFLVIRYKTLHVKLLYRLFLLEQARSPKVYFPFLYMLTDFNEALVKFSSKWNTKVFSSIRGTEVTINPYTKPGILDVYGSIIPYIYKLHFLSSLLQEQFLALGLTSPKNQIIYQGIDLSKFLQAAQLPEDKLRIITVGRFNYVKGLEYLLLACRHLKNNKVDFMCTIAGYGHEKEKYLYMIHDLDLGDCVFLTENISHSNLSALLLNHNVYVHPHLVTGISNTMLEAFASGLKTIAFHSKLDSYDVPDLTLYFTEVPRYDVAGLAEALQNFNHRYFIPIDIRSRILEKFTLDAQVEAFTRFFELDKTDPSERPVSIN